MAIVFPGGAPLPTVEALRALANDLEHMTVFIPSADQLGDAPQLDDWLPYVRGAGALTGHVNQHPLLGSRRIVTSEIYAIDHEAGWARSFSRFYRLGKTKATH